MEANTSPSRVESLAGEIPMEKGLDSLTVFVRRVVRVGSPGYEMDICVAHERYSHLGRVVDGQWRPVSMPRVQLTVDEQTRVVQLAEALRAILSEMNA